MSTRDWRTSRGKRTRWIRGGDRWTHPSLLTESAVLFAGDRRPRWRTDARTAMLARPDSRGHRVNMTTRRADLRGEADPARGVTTRPQRQARLALLFSAALDGRSGELLIACCNYSISRYSFSVRGAYICAPRTMSLADFHVHCKIFFIIQAPIVSDFLD